jgi:hypothetical protein
MRSSPQIQLFVADLSDYEREGGTCPTCGAHARLLTCWECCDSAWVIECSHRSDRPSLASGRLDGSDPHRIFCSECADVLLDEP